MAAAFALCAVLGVANAAWQCDDPTVVACEIAVKDTLKSSDVYERLQAEVLGQGAATPPRVRLHYNLRKAEGQEVRGATECFFKANATCANPDGSLEHRCLQLSSVRIDGRFLPEKAVAHSVGERSKAGVVTINPRDTELVSPDPVARPAAIGKLARPAEQLARPAERAAPATGPKPLPVYEITAKGQDQYAADYREASRLWELSRESVQEACMRGVRHGDRPYRMLSECLSARLKLAE